ncbi:MAG: hypothetical protein U0L76_01115 [Ruminococcus sp.]|nr:hypothetical protein [Ruminococcus sp.]
MRKSNYIPDFKNSDYKTIELPECVFLSERCKCAILSVKECVGEKCTFKKTAVDIEKSDRKVRDYLNALDISKQNKISQEYYGGKMPWRKR